MGLHRAQAEVERGTDLAKAAVLTGAALTVLVLVGGLGYGYGRVVTARHDPAVLPPDAWRQIGAAALVRVMAALLGLAFGALLRNGAVAVVVLMAVLYVIPLVVLSLPGGEDVGGFLPLAAGLELLRQTPQTMPASTAVAVCAAWALVPLAIALAVSRRPGSTSR
ncbi:hypothetical protein [Nonomuraea terrae]|uniref:hypothetical protein n=1 Tax=Nonomuraea terrae TaxID=2530383 RepID=UPI001405141F|nr:hypothetical protein [Nonomuraea terrae]